jgi:hypothetical protein
LNTADWLFSASRLFGCTRITSLHESMEEIGKGSASAALDRDGSQQEVTTVVVPAALGREIGTDLSITVLYNF